MNPFADLIFALALSPWAYVVLAILLIVDGFFPLVPGETTVIALASLGASGHGPTPLSVLVVATAATMVGDGIAFAIGRRFGKVRWSGAKRPRAARTVRWARDQIHLRPILVLVAAKFIPIGRVAVTMGAGASPLSIRKYLLCSFTAATIYTSYHVVVAATAGTLLASNPLLGLLASIGFGFAIGGVIALITRAVTRRRTAFASQPLPR